MPSVTTAELVSRAKAVSDMRDNFVTPTQWMYWASQERLSLDLFLARSGWMLNFTSLDITITGLESGVFNVAPIGGVMAIVAVHEVTAQGVRPIKYQDAISFYKQTAGATATPQGHPKYYRMSWSGDNMVMNFFPEPRAGEVYRVTYVAHPLRLTTDASPASGYANSVSYPMGWEERIVLGMARRALIKEESDTREVDKEIQLWEGRIEEACWDRVLGETPSIRNMDAADRGWTVDMRYPAYTQWWWS